MAVSGNDIANVNTKGYEQSDLVQVERTGGTAAGAIIKTPNYNPEESGTDLAREFGGEMPIAQAGYSASLKVIKTQDEMLGSLMDLKG
jgi:flagellar hook protein FlgE